ncbi:RDD family protein [Acinetobacter seifertii]|uniref:RDD family protein n=1 Tax=Acinetobacter seifertii TaxID=1530123 RepID=UPI003AF78E39
MFNKKEVFFLPIKIDNETVYAGFWKRLSAGIIDMLVMIPLMIIGYFTQNISIIISMITVVIAALFAITYIIYFHYRFGATIGKMVVGIKITRPDGSKISLIQAVLRSSVDIVFCIITVISELIALSYADPEIYLNAGKIDQAKYILLFYPAWYSIVNSASELWTWSEFIVLLFNKRKRAIHDFIAGTIVIKKQYSKN